MAKNQFPAPPEFFEDLFEQAFKLGSSIRQVLRGKTNNTGDVTLRANETTTEIVDLRITLDSLVFLTPSTSTAAAALAAIYITYATGKATITHDSTADTDRTFGYVIHG